MLVSCLKCGSEVKLMRFNVKITVFKYNEDKKEQPGNVTI